MVGGGGGGEGGAKQLGWGWRGGGESGRRRGETGGMGMGVHISFTLLPVSSKSCCSVKSKLFALVRFCQFFRKFQSV